MDKKKALKNLTKLQKNIKNCRFETIQNILLAFNFEESQPSGGSSHYKYSKDSNIVIVPRKNPIKEVYVKNIIKLLEDIINEEHT